MGGAAISSKELSVGYGKKVVVSGLGFEVRAGEILTIIGPNGAGKSTILKTIAAQLPAIAGSVSINDTDISLLSSHEAAQTLSVCLTERITAEKMTCADVVSTGRYPYTGLLGILSDSDRKIVREAMELTGISHLADTDIRCISDGQRQTVMLARAVAQEPQVLILDEPTSFLDINNKLRLLELLRELVRSRNIAVVQTLHELDLAQRFSDTILCVRDGRADRKGGGGSGIDTYRSLQRQGIPFAAGVIHENDIEYPTAKALASVLITEKAFEPVSSASVELALEAMNKCGRVICCIKSFGTVNMGNKKLLEAAEKAMKTE